MAHYSFDETKPHGRQLRRSLDYLREFREDFFQVRNVMTQMLTGDGSSTAHFAEVVTRFGFADTSKAKAAWDELNSLNGKLTVDTSVTNVDAAINQTLAQFG